MALTVTDLIVPPELLTSVIDRVERLGEIGRDASGAPVEGVTVIYTNLPAAVDLRMAGEQNVFGQQVAELGGFVYFARTADGSLPDIRSRDRFLFGVWPGTNTPRYLNVTEDLDELEQGVVMQVPIRTRRPA